MGIFTLNERCLNRRKKKNVISIKSFYVIWIFVISHRAPIVTYVQTYNDMQIFTVKMTTSAYKTYLHTVLNGGGQTKTKNSD